MAGSFLTYNRELGPLHRQVLEAAFSCRTPEMRDAPLYIRHAVWERLSTPRLLIQFPLVWMDDAGHVRVDTGFCAACTPAPPDRCVLLFRPALTADGITALAFLNMLENQLLALSPGAILCGADHDPSPLSDGESMRFCRALLDGVRRCIPAHPPLSAAPDMPERERGYLGLPPSGHFPAARAAGYALACFVREALRRRGHGNLNEKTLSVRGPDPTGYWAAESARRMGAQLLPDGDEAADVILLCDIAAPLDASDAERLIDRRPDGVFEALPLACTPEAAGLLRRSGLLFVPSAAVRAGAAVSIPEGLSAWQTERILRTAAEAVYRKLQGPAPDDLCRNAYAEALRTAADELVRRGV